MNTKDILDQLKALGNPARHAHNVRAGAPENQFGVMFGDIRAIAKKLKTNHELALKDGDTVQVIKDLKVKGASSSVKVGTKVKNIRLVDGDHDIDCKIDGFGAMKLKSEFVKKA